MNSPQFDIVFRGVREGFTEPQVKAQFAALFKLDANTTARIFRAKKVTLKAHIAAPLADKYVTRLAAIGVLVDKIAIAPEYCQAKLPPVAELSPVAKPAQPSKAIKVRDYGVECIDAGAMHQPVEFLYAEQITRIPFVFTGKGLDYGKIWLVNLLVCVLSAGLLYPWAQLRARRYFYQHISLAGAEFKAGQACYHKIKFSHKSSWQSAYGALLLWPLASLLTLGLLAPVAAYQMQRYSLLSKSFGGFPFQFTQKLKPYWVLLPPLIVAEVVSLAVFHWRQLLPVWLLSLVLCAAWLHVFIAWRFALVKLYWSAASCRLGYFVASWELPAYRRLLVRNLLLCIVTLGFYWPWAKVSLARYQAKHLAFFANLYFKKWSGRVS